MADGGGEGRAGEIDVLELPDLRKGGGRGAQVAEEGRWEDNARWGAIPEDLRDDRGAGGERGGAEDDGRGEEDGHLEGHRHADELFA